MFLTNFIQSYYFIYNFSTKHIFVSNTTKAKTNFLGPDHTWAILSRPRSHHSKVSLFFHNPVSFACCICGIISFIHKIMLLCATHEPMLLAFTITWVCDSSKLNSHLELSPKMKPIQTWHVALWRKRLQKIERKFGYWVHTYQWKWHTEECKNKIHILNPICSKCSNTNWKF